MHLESEIPNDDLWQDYYRLGVVEPYNPELADPWALAESLGLVSELEAPETAALKIPVREVSIAVLTVATALAAFGLVSSVVSALDVAPSINLSQDKLPAKLPAAVGRAITDSGYIDLQTSANASWSGSGIELDGNEFLTAGHMVRNDDGSQIKASEICKNINVYVKGQTTAQTLTVSNFSSSYDAYSTAPDMALLETSPDNQTSYVNVANTAPFIGQQLFFVNYEPTNSGKLRDPTLATRRFDDPAVYGGIVLNQHDGASSSEFDVLTNLQSYGTIKQADTVPGASGGPVFNAKGELVGISDATYNDFMDPSGIKSVTDTQVDDRGSHYYQITVVQSVSLNSLVNQYGNQSNPQACH